MINLINQLNVLLANLWNGRKKGDRATMILPEVSAPIQHSVMYPESLSEGDIPPEEPSFSPGILCPSDDYSISEGDSHVAEKKGPSLQSRASRQAEGVTPAEHPVNAGTRRIAESIAQGLHHVAKPRIPCT